MTGVQTCALPISNPENEKDLNKRQSIITSLEYMGLKSGTKLEDIKLDQVFIGSCTNSRIEDLREVANIVKGKHVKIKAMVVPGSGLVRQQAEEEGLDKIFKEAGFEWRESGCSMCLAMNADKLKSGERCASTSNRNFEGRQGKKKQSTNSEQEFSPQNDPSQTNQSSDLPRIRRVR